MLPLRLNVKPCEECGFPIVRGLMPDGSTVWLDRRAPVYAVDYTHDKADANGQRAYVIFKLRNALAAHFVMCAKEEKTDAEGERQSDSRVNSARQA
jgi:hypothetical protein